MYGTDVHGTVRVVTDGTTYAVHPQRTAEARAPPPPGPAPTQPAATPGKTLEIVSVTSPIGRGSTATLVANAWPGAPCAITVIYKSGPSKAKGLEPKTAGADGRVAWSWTVGSRTTPGPWPITVTCGDKTVQTQIQVQ